MHLDTLDLNDPARYPLPIRVACTRARYVQVHPSVSIVIFQSTAHAGALLQLGIRDRTLCFVT